MDNQDVNLINSEEIEITQADQDIQLNVSQKLKDLYVLQDTLDQLYEALGIKADSYDKTKTYAVGDLVVYNHIIYECNRAITTAEDFDSSKWTIVPLIER